jgi:hypothetical protein
VNFASGPSDARPVDPPEQANSSIGTSVDIDKSVAHAGRVYDYFLGGTTNFEVDRSAAEYAAAVHPGGLETVQASVRSNRAFLVRAVRWLGREVGMRQYMDIGAGIPNGTDVHVVAQQMAPGSRVVYVDNDPIVLAHAHERLKVTDDGGPVAYVHGDLRDTSSILQQATTTLDFTQPIAALLVGVLHLLPDDPHDPYALVADLMDALPAESHLVISHLAMDIHPAEMAEVQRRFNESTAETWQLRNRDLVRGFFAGLDLVDPGVVQLDEWHPDDDPRPVLPPEGRTNPVWAGVGRKP